MLSAPVATGLALQFHRQHATPTQSRLGPRASALPLQRTALPARPQKLRARRDLRLAVSAEALSNKGKQFSAADVEVKRILGEGSYGAAYEVSAPLHEDDPRSSMAGGHLALLDVLFLLSPLALRCGGRLVHAGRKGGLLNATRQPCFAIYIRHGEVCLHGGKHAMPRLNMHAMHCAWRVWETAPLVQT